MSQPSHSDVAMANKATVTFNCEIHKKKVFRRKVHLYLDRQKKNEVEPPLRDKLDCRRVITKYFVKFFAVKFYLVMKLGLSTGCFSHLVAGV